MLAQIALSLALLFSAALFVRSSSNAASLGLGFQTAQQLVASVDYKLAHLDPATLYHRQQALLASAATLPSVTGAALASSIPYNFELSSRQVRATHATDPSGTGDAPRQSAGYTAVTRGYFTTLGIALLRGRDFSAEESAGTAVSPVAIVDEGLARALFGDADALGRQISTQSGPAGGTSLEIIGIVRSPR